MHTITVSHIPSVNHYVKHTKRGYHYKPKEVEAFETMVKLQLAKIQLPNWVKADIAKKKPLSLNIIFFLNKNFYKRDLDNMLKCFIDCLAKMYGFNDSYIKHIECGKRFVKELPEEKIMFRFSMLEA